MTEGQKIGFAIVGFLLLPKLLKGGGGAQAGGEIGPSYLGYSNLPRGIRNNNPGNIRKSANNWVGKIVPGSDPDFEQFSNIVYGVRALMVNLRTYINRGNDTISKIIYKWAPPSENNTLNYVSFVESCTGINRDKEITFNEVEIKKIARCISYVENKTPNIDPLHYVTQSVLDAAYKLV